MNRESVIEEVDNGFIIKIGSATAVFTSWRKAREFLDSFYADRNDGGPSIDPNAWTGGYPVGR